MPKNKKEMEYIGLTTSKKNYGEKNLLYCQINSLTILKKIDIYKKLRKEEFALKRILKRKVKETYEIINKLEEMLPETKYDKFKPIKIHKTSKKRKDLESEIEYIKRKIAELH
jgi:hypothetical protein|tara:strand:- start:73 stop:411 length:339 start_codon:yes stop_codon:yes gene_type:complete